MNPLRLLPIILCFGVCTLCFPASAQTTSLEIVRKVTATNAISEDLNFLTGRTLTIGSGATETIASGATFNYATGAVFTGDLVEFRADIGLAIGTDVEAHHANLSAISAGTWTGAASITTLGTVATGTWSASTIAVNKGGSGQTSYTDGQLLIGNSSGNTLTKTTLTAGSGVTVTNGAGSITISSTGALARAYVAGLNLANNASDATNDIDVSPGTARGALNLADLTLTTATTKRLDAAWSAGTGNGGLDQGTIANATYHVHLIGDGAGTTDVIFSLSHDKSATVTMTIASPCVVTWGTTNHGHGLVAGSPFKFSTTGALPTGVTAGTQYYVISAGLTETAFEFSATNGGSAVNTSGTQSGVHTGLAGPQMPIGYTYYRRIGCIVRASAAILPFAQYGSGTVRRYALTTPVQDVNTSTLSTARTTFTASSVPTGLNLLGRFRMGMTNASATFVNAVNLDEADAAPSPTAAPGSLLSNTAGGWISLQADIITNAAAQIGARAAAASTTFRVVTLGWTDDLSY